MAKSYRNGFADLQQLLGDNRYLLQRSWGAGPYLGFVDRAYTAAIIKLRSQCLHLAFLDGISRKKDTPSDLETLTEEILRAFLN